jgi:hypothetical protein
VPSPGRGSDQEPHDIRIEATLTGRSRVPRRSTSEPEVFVVGVVKQFVTKH